jgi:hypothetical protein
MPVRVTARGTVRAALSSADSWSIDDRVSLSVWLMPVRSTANKL